jgi:glycosyltransferase involved in cell wall biosynthesis
MSTTIYQRKKEISTALKLQFGRDNKLQGLESMCLYVFAGANQIKKNIGAMVDAFALLQKEKPDIALLLALKPIDCQIGTYKFSGEYDIPDLMSGIPNLFVINQALADPVHANIFKMADFLLYPSQGEAPGLQVSEAQLCGTIPICTNYTGLPEESCFEEFLIKDFTLMRGQFNCYRAIVSAEALKEKMEIGYDFWKVINGQDTLVKEGLLKRYERFWNDVQTKFKDRTWEHAAMELDEVIQSLLNKSLRIDLELSIL